MHERLRRRGVEFCTFRGTPVCGRARAGLCTSFGSFALLVGQSAPGHLGVAALVPLRLAGGELPVRRAGGFILAGSAGSIFLSTVSPPARCLSLPQQRETKQFSL